MGPPYPPHSASTTTSTIRVRVLGHAFLIYMSTALGRGSADLASYRPLPLRIARNSGDDIQRIVALAVGWRSRRVFG